MKKVGRPKSETHKAKVVSVRFLPEEFDELKKYADSAGTTVSNVVHESIKLFMSCK